MNIEKFFYFLIASLLASLMNAINFYIAVMIMIDYYGKSSSSYIVNTFLVLVFLSFVLIWFFLEGINQSERNLIPPAFYLLHVLNILFVWLIVFGFFYCYILDNWELLYIFLPICLIFLILYFVGSSYLRKNTWGSFYFGNSFFKLLFFLLISSLILASAVYITISKKIINRCDSNLDNISLQECRYRVALESRGYDICIKLKGRNEDDMTYRDKCLIEKAVKQRDYSLCRLIDDDLLLEKCLNLTSEQKAD
jgi:hypothetical protein